MAAATSDHSIADALVARKPRYHSDKAAPYALPNDAPEHVRLEAQAQHLLAIMNYNIIHAPIPTDINNVKMLDVGCGTGIVTDFIGNRFPSAQVYGLDLSPVPNLRTHPPNVQYLQGNILQTSPHQWRPQENSSLPNALPSSNQNLFHLIFSRLLVCGMNDWPGYITKVYNLLQPSGYAEMHDLDWTMYDNRSQPILTTSPWLLALSSAARAKGMDLNCASKLSTWMAAAGFKDIHIKTYRWPIGGAGEEDETWAKWGDFNASQVAAMGHHLVPRILEGNSEFTEEQVEEFREGLKRDMQPSEDGKYFLMYVVVGKKGALAV